MAEQTNYEQLKPEHRMVIASLRLQGKGVRSIARAIDRAPSTVSRELRRNTCPESGYISDLK